MPERDETHAVRLDTSTSAIERRETTLRLLLAADLAPGSEPRLLRLGEGGVAALQEELAPRLELRVADVLGANREDLEVSLLLDRPSAFSPDSIAAAVPELAAVGEARRLADDVAHGRRGAGELEEGLPRALAEAGIELPASGAAGAPASSSGSPAGEASQRSSSEVIDSIFDTVDAPDGGGEAPTAAGLADLLAGATSAGSQPTADAATRESLAALVEELDRRLAAQVEAIVARPELRRLEAAWGGLGLFVDHAGRRRRVLVDVLATPREGLLDSFFEHVFHDEYEQRSDVPLTAVVAAYAFGRRAGELEILRTAARMGASLRVPFLAQMSPAYWGVRRARLLAKLPDLIQKSAGPEYATWNRLRGSDDSLWLALAANRVFLRDRWGVAGSTPVESFAWQTSDGDPLWADGVWALAAAIVRGFSTGGLQFPVTGPEPTRVEGLSLPSEEIGHGPLEVDLGGPRALELAMCGFAPLVATKEGGGAFFPAAPTFHAAKRYSEEEATRSSFRAASLPYQLLAAVVSAAVDRVARGLSEDASEEETAKRFRDRVLGLLATRDAAPSAEAVAVEVVPREEEPGVVDVTVRVRPEFEIYGGEADLLVGTTVNRRAE